MTLTVTPSGQACGARIEGIDLTTALSDDQIAELRQLWLEHKVVAFPNQALTPEDLERVAQYFGEIGEDPFFGHIEDYPSLCASRRGAADRVARPGQAPRVAAHGDERVAAVATRGPDATLLRSRFVPIAYPQRCTQRVEDIRGEELRRSRRP